MIWLASFPRSGNTFFRNILFEVFGLESSTFHIDPDYPLDKNYTQFEFVKTHLLPLQLVPNDSHIKSIYLIRDGRDVMCSMAHHRKDIVAPGSDYYENLKAAIIAERGSFFGGWSKNVMEWVIKADLIIRYEDLLVDPQKELERVSQIYDLPKAHWDRLSSFQQMKSGIQQYGSGINRNISKEEMKDLSTKNFRKGKAGSWKIEMPKELEELFWSFHGETMLKLGYQRSGSIKPPHQDLSWLAYEKLGYQRIPGIKHKILMEANKLVSNDNDGVKRYQKELLQSFLPMVENPHSNWQIDLLIHHQIFSLQNQKSLILNDFKRADIENGEQLSEIKPILKKLEQSFINAIPDRFVLFLKKRNIQFFHQTYDFFRVGFMAILNYFSKSFRRSIHFLFCNKNKEASIKTDYGIFADYHLIHLPLMQHYQPFVNVPNKAFLITIHDFTHRYFPQFHTETNIRNAEKGLEFIQQKNADIIAVSLSTYNDAKKDLGIDVDKIHLTYEAADNQKFYYSINSDDNLHILSKYGIQDKRPYFLCLSTIEPRKNLANTIQAFIALIENKPELNCFLVIAGKQGWMAKSSLVHNKLLSDRIIFTGFIDDEDLSAVYTESLALCYLSYYEGFGLPALEAMRCKTPVIFGNNSSLIEVVGKGGLAADPENIEDIRNQMNNIITDSQLRTELSNFALEQSNTFSWFKTAEETLKAYETIFTKKE